MKLILLGLALGRIDTPQARQLIEEIANESTNEPIGDQARNHLTEWDKMAKGFEEARPRNVDEAGGRI